MTLRPVALVNGAVALVEAAIALAVGFGLDWTAEQVGLVMAVVVAVAALVKTLWDKGQVSPVASPGDAEGPSLVSEVR